LAPGDPIPRPGAREIGAPARDRQSRTRSAIATADLAPHCRSRTDLRSVVRAQVVHVAAVVDARRAVVVPQLETAVGCEARGEADDVAAADAFDAHARAERRDDPGAVRVEARGVRVAAGVLPAREDLAE